MRGMAFRGMVGGALILLAIPGVTFAGGRGKSPRNRSLS